MAKHPPISFTIRPVPYRPGVYWVEGDVTFAGVVAAESFSEAVKGKRAAEALRQRMELIEIEARAHVAEIAAALKAEREARRLARKAQDFDTSTLPLFGDGHKQMDLF